MTDPQNTFEIPLGRLLSVAPGLPTCHARTSPASTGTPFGAVRERGNRLSCDAPCRGGRRGRYRSCPNQHFAIRESSAARSKPVPYEEATIHADRETPAGTLPTSKGEWRRAAGTRRLGSAILREAHFVVRMRSEPIEPKRVFS